jgi:hypothetical protein
MPVVILAGFYHDRHLHLSTHCQLLRPTVCLTLLPCSPPATMRAFQIAKHAHPREIKV